MKRMKNILMKVIGYFSKPKQVEPVKPLKSVTKHDVEVLMQTFPPFTYKKGMSHEEIVVGVMQSEGEQRILRFILNRIQGRVDAGPAL